MKRDELLSDAMAQVDPLVADQAVDHKVASHLMSLLSEIVSDDQPKVQVSVNHNIRAIEANWLVHGRWAVLFVDPDGFWSFWLDSPDGSPAYELDDREGGVGEDDLNEIQRILGSLGSLLH